MSDFKLKDFYIPPHSLNKEEFPGHILWNGDCSLIVLSFSTQIKCVNIYNASRNEDKINEKIILTNFEVPGYVGLGFIGDLDSEVNAYFNIECEFYSSDNNLLFKSERTIQIFRPSIVLKDDYNERKTIEIERDTSSLKYTIRNRLRLGNVGKATALISLDLESNDSGIDLALPPHFLEFYTSFFNDLKLRFRELSRNFSGYSKVIWQFYRVSLNFPLLIKEGKTEIIDEAHEAMGDITQNDHTFREEYQKSVLVSYLKNIPLITEIGSFVDYLNSVGKGRVILINSIFHIKSKENQDTGSAILKLSFMDLGSHKYKDLNLGKVNFKFKGTNTVPVHMIFDWTDNGDSTKD